MLRNRQNTSAFICNISHTSSTTNAKIEIKQRFQSSTKSFCQNKCCKGETKSRARNLHSSSSEAKKNLCKPCDKTPSYVVEDKNVQEIWIGPKARTLALPMRLKKMLHTTKSDMTYPTNSQSQKLLTNDHG